jgi:hypothetical protein
MFIQRIKPTARYIAIKNKGLTFQVVHDFWWIPFCWMKFSSKLQDEVPVTAWYTLTGVVPIPGLYLWGCKSWNQRNKHNNMKNQPMWTYFGIAEWPKHLSNIPLLSKGIVGCVPIPWPYLWGCKSWNERIRAIHELTCKLTWTLTHEFLCSKS